MPQSFQRPKRSSSLIYSSARLTPPVKGRPAVDDHELAVVAVIEPGGEDGHVGG